MTWQDDMREQLIALRGNRPIQEFATDTGLGLHILYKILSGERGIGANSLEKLRITQPDLVASVFLPDRQPTLVDAKERYKTEPAHAD